MELSPVTIALVAGLTATALSYAAERLHARRTRAVGRLAFGPAAAPRGWTRFVPTLSAVACGLAAWGLVVLLLAPPEPLDKTGEDAEAPKEAELQRVIIALDVSPSMSIVDAGPGKNKRRSDRILEVTEGICSRIALARTRFSVIAFFTSSRTVVVDASDIGVIRNVLDNLPLTWSFEPGETQLLEGVRGAAELARDWPPDSTTLLLCTDGDTTDFTKIPELPRSIGKVDILAVGDPIVGTFINNHDSRQQAGILRRLAAELHGSYYDVNTRHVPSSALAELAFVPPEPSGVKLRLKDFALIAVAIGAVLLTLIPLLLEYFGSGWNAERELPVTRRESEVNDESAKVDSHAPKELVG